MASPPIPPKQIAGVTVKSQMDVDRVTRAIERAKQGNLRSQAYLLMRDAKDSIRRARKRKPAPVGQPAYQHVAGWKAAIAYAMEQKGNDAVIGFRASYVDQTAAVHEHGLTEEGRQYPKRPTMGPALERNVDRFHRSWRNSIGM